MLYAARRVVRNTIKIPVAFTAAYLLAALVAGPIVDRDSWVRLGWVITFSLAILSAVLLWTVFGLRGGTKALVVTGLLGPLAITGSIAGALTLIRNAHDRKVAFQIAHSRISNVRDEPLPGPKGHPVGVRIRYRVEYDEGLDDDRWAPFATVHVVNPAANLSVAGRHVESYSGGAYAKGTYEITEDFLPNFTPFLFRESAELCFQWPGAEWKAGVLSSGPQQYEVFIQPYRLRSQTAGTYEYRNLYEGAVAEGVRECQ
jgi:hypothetical protein